MTYTCVSVVNMSKVVGLCSLIKPEFYQVEPTIKLTFKLLETNNWVIPFSNQECYGSVVYLEKAKWKTKELGRHYSKHLNLYHYAIPPQMEPCSKDLLTTKRILNSLCTLAMDKTTKEVLEHLNLYHFALVSVYALRKEPFLRHKLCKIQEV